MLPPDGALLVHGSLAAVCWSVTRLVARAAGPVPEVTRRLRRAGAFLAVLLAAAVGALTGTDAHVAAWLETTRPGLAPDVAPTVGTLALFLGPVPLAAYAAYRGADGATGHAPDSLAGFTRGYALVIAPTMLATALFPAIPSGWWLVVGVFAFGLTLAAGTPLFVRRLVPTRPLTAAEARQLPDLDLPVYVLSDRGQANAFAAGVLPGFRCVFVTERLVNLLTPAELSAILAHEVGHHRRRYVALRLGAVAAFVLPWLGATALAVPGGFVTGLVLLLPATLAIARLVRWTEFDADAEATRRVGPDTMASALRRLGPIGSRRSRLDQVSGLFALHPPLASRIAKITRRDTDTHPRRPRNRPDDSDL
jgi:Zn-dependent protease with chaperone function